MKDIKKEFQLVKIKKCYKNIICKRNIFTSFKVCSRLRLANRTHEITAPTMTPDETVALLVNANLFEDAVNLAKIFELDFRYNSLNTYLKRYSD